MLRTDWPTTRHVAIKPRRHPLDLPVIIATRLGKLLVRMDLIHQQWLNQGLINALPVGAETNLGDTEWWAHDTRVRATVTSSTVSVFEAFLGHRENRGVAHFRPAPASNVWTVAARPFAVIKLVGRHFQ